MIGWILAFMAYDTVKTVSQKNKEEEKRMNIQKLKWRLQSPMTQGHTKKCICRLCVNRRTSATTELNKMLLER